MLKAIRVLATFSGLALVLNTSPTLAASSQVLVSKDDDKKKKPFMLVIPMGGINGANIGNEFTLADGTKITFKAAIDQHQKGTKAIPDPATTLTEKILAYCETTPGNPPSTKALGFLTPVVGLLIEASVKLIFKKAEDALSTKLKAFSNTSTASVSGSFFSIEGGRVKANRQYCLRVIRGTYRPGKGDEHTVQFDSIIQTRFAGAPLATAGLSHPVGLQLVPLLTYTNLPAIDAAKKADKVAYSLNAKMTGLAVVDGIQTRLEQFDTPVLVGQYKPKEKGTFRRGKEDAFAMKWTKTVYWDERTAANNERVLPHLPILPMPGSLIDNGVPTGVGTLEFSLVETGTGRRKTKIEDWQKFLKDVEDDVASGLSSAVTSLLEDGEDASGMTETSASAAVPADGS